MNKENTILTLAAATCTSGAVLLAYSRTPPVIMLTVALLIFTLILDTGWKAAGVTTFLGLDLWSFISLWIWLALVFWFAFLSGGVWAVALCVMALSATIAVIWKKTKHAENS